MESLFQDVRFGFRILLRTPILTLAILVSLALGIGANTAMFSILDAVVLRPARFPSPSTLALVWEREPQGGLRFTSAANFLDWRERASSFTELAAWSPISYVMTGADTPRQISGAAVSANFFHVLQARPVLGRTFLPGEDGIPNPADASHVAILSYEMWQGTLGGDPNVIGRILRLNQVAYAVVGVMGPDFRFLRGPQSLWVPVNMNRANRDYRFLTVVGRLGKPRSAAVAEMSALAQSLAVAYPKTNKGWTIQVDDFQDWLTRTSYPARLLLVAGALGLILLIACTNIASLLLTRSSARSRELSMRIALGAPPSRIIRQLLIESLLLAVSGGFFGVVLAWMFINAAPTILPMAVIPAGAPLEVSPVVLLFTAGLTLATGVFFGLFPAISAARSKVQQALKESSRGSTGGRAQRWFREGMVVFEVAMALMLISSAGLVIASLRKLEAQDPGSRIDHLLTMHIFLPVARYNAPQALALHKRAMERIRALPGVESATVATNLPLLQLSMEVPFDLETAPPRSLEERPGVAYVGISPGYLETLGIPLKRGRMFTEQDNENSPPVVIINEAFASRYFPGQDPVGQKLQLNRPILGKDEFDDTIHPQIVGVIGNVKMGRLTARQDAILYAPHAQNVWSASTWIAIRSSSDPAALTSAVRREIFSLDKDLPLDQANTLEQVYFSQFAEPKFESQLMAGLSGLALVLAGIGIYSVNAYVVSERGGEIALRIALGASTHAILKDILGRGLRLALAGIAAGFAGAVFASKSLKSTLVGIGSLDPVTLSAAALLLVLISMLACLFPARKAMRIDPAVALRQD